MKKSIASRWSGKRQRTKDRRLRSPCPARGRQRVGTRARVRGLLAQDTGRTEETMKANYKNWVPKGMLWGVYAATILVVGLFVWSVTALHDLWRMGLGTLFGVLSLVGLFGAVTLTRLYHAFSYDGTQRLSAKIVEGVAAHVTLPAGGKGLDVGCGSGALTIACAKRNPEGTMVGVDRWGLEYASFSQALCEQNAQAEGVAVRTEFLPGDARHLPFEDETFDAVTSNYVYHNIGGIDRKKLLEETLRVLKPGGTFAIHDLFAASYYKGLEAWIAALSAAGYEDVALLDTAQGKFIAANEAKSLWLSGSKLLLGRKGTRNTEQK